VVAPLSLIDREIDARGRRTLAPARDRATTLAELDHRIGGQLSAEVRASWIEGLASTARAILTHFPENILWDLDHLAASIAAYDDVAEVREAFALIAELHELFGGASAIRFRYTHDFVYGFDWAKWVRRDPSARSHVGPFDLVFLRALLDRGGELVALIEDDDALYPRLKDDRPRNPFPFSRERDAELALYEDLRARDLIPVRAWTFDAPPVWNAPFAEARVERAIALGLT
jgi:hypothetical protein